MNSETKFSFSIALLEINNKFASYANLARHPNCQTGDKESVQVRQKVSSQRQNGGVVPGHISLGCDFEYAPLKSIVQGLLTTDRHRATDSPLTKMSK